MTFDPMRRGRSNRDRRDAAFARGVIAIAEQHRRQAEAIEDAACCAIEPERCLMCNNLLSGNCEIRDEHYPYCSAMCSISAQQDSPEDEK